MKKKTKTTCRICLRFGSKVQRTCKSLFEIHNGSTILNNITLVANVKIQEDDGLPSKICAECLTELDAAVSFKEKCERSNKILHSESEFEQTESTTFPYPELPIQIEEVIKKEEVSEDDIQYEEVNYYYDECDEVEKPIETEIDKPDETEIEKPDETEIDELNKAEIEAPDKTEKEEPVLTLPSKSELKCQDCSEIFKSFCKLRVHWKRVHMLEKLICKFCKRAFKSPSTYQNHLKKRPQNCILASKTRIEGVGRSRIFYCRHCSFSSRRPHDFENHFNIHTGDRPFSCKLCSKGYSQQNSLDAHNEVVHKIIKKEITCQYCGELVKGRDKIRRHMDRHTRSPVQCDICKKMFKSKSTLIEHLNIHTGVKRFQCEKCASSYYSLHTLINHRRNVHNANKLNYKCGTCGCKFVSARSLKKHEHKHMIFSEVCNVCGRFYLTSEELESHRKIHTKEKSVCLQCNRIFCDEKSLKRHKRTTHKHRQNLMRAESVKAKNVTTEVECKDEKIEVKVS